MIDSWYGVTALDIAGKLEKADGKDIVVRINSPGGDVFEARAIATLLREYNGGVDIHIDGVAASAASYIAISGDKCTIAQGAMMMIHNAWAVGMGNANDLLELAAVLTQIDDSLASDYAAKCGKPKQEILDAMAATTWLSAEDTKAFGLADEVSDPKRSKKTTGDDGEPDQTAPADLMAQFPAEALPGLPEAQRAAMAAIAAARKQAEAQAAAASADNVIHAEKSFSAAPDEKDRIRGFLEKGGDPGLLRALTTA